MKIIKLKFSQLIYSSVHIGHPLAQSNNFSTWYVYGLRYSTLIISPAKMVFFWKKASLALYYLSSKFGSVLFVNLDPALNYLLHRMNNIIQQPMILDKWRGGLLTNWKFVFLRKIPDFKKGFFLNTWSHDFMKNLKGSTRLPSALFSFNTGCSTIPFQEARTVNIPVFSLSDSTSDTRDILYPLPGNDDAVSSVTFCSVTISKSILIGRLAGVSKYMRYKKVHSSI